MPNDATPVTRTMPLREAQKSLDKLIAEVSQGNARVLIEQNGSQTAALVSHDDLLRLQQLDGRRREALHILAESQAAFAGEPPETIEAEVRKAITAVRRAKRRRQRSTTSA